MAQRARGNSLEARLYRELPALVGRNAEAIRRDIPHFWRRSGGYRLERLLPERGPFNLANAVVGSEGTLALVTEAEVSLVPDSEGRGGGRGTLRIGRRCDRRERRRARMRRGGHRTGRSIHPRPRAPLQGSRRARLDAARHAGRGALRRVLRRRGRRMPRGGRSPRAHVAPPWSRLRHATRRERRRAPPIPGPAQGRQWDAAGIGDRA